MSSESKESLLHRVPDALNVPAMVIQDGVDKLDIPVQIQENTYFPNPTFTKYRLDAQKRRRPQCIAHRGYKNAFPENTMAAFKGAVAVGAQALETDVHSTKDDVVVLNHDTKLLRTFGRNVKITDSNWDDIKDSRTLQAPHEPIPQLKELLEYLAQPGMEELWLLLDIKLANDAETIMRNLGATIASVTPAAKKAWKDRVILGVWAAYFLPFAVDYLPGFPVTCIGFSVPYARNFLKLPNVSFNMLLPILFAPGGRSFIHDTKEKHGRQLYTWVANDKEKMEWCIRRNFDGVITDDPQKFVEVCEQFDEYETEPWKVLTLKGYFDMVRVWLWVTVAMLLFKRRLGSAASKHMIETTERRTSAISKR